MRQIEISNTDDVIDSRDVIEKIEELEGEETLEQEEKGELKALKALAEEVEGYAPDWTYGVTLINEGYFTEYAKELCEDIGAVPKDMPSYIAIDWDQTAENLKVNYTEVEFNGQTYLVR